MIFSKSQNIGLFDFLNPKKTLNKLICISNCPIPIPALNKFKGAVIGFKAITIFKYTFEVIVIG